MIQYIQGQDILDAKTEVVVCSVTTAGLMEKGLSFQVASKYPDVEVEYKEALKQGVLDIGKVWAVSLQEAPYIIVLFPTSRERTRQSSLEYIIKGMIALREVIKGHGFKSIAMPKLGTGVGGLEWEEVQREIVNTLLENMDDTDVFIYE